MCSKICIRRPNADLVLGSTSPPRRSGLRPTRPTLPVSAVWRNLFSIQLLPPKASDVHEEESEIGQALGETAADLQVAVEENAAEKLQLEGEKIVVEAKAAEVDKEAQIQLNRSAVINNILNETKEILAQNVADEIEDTKAALKAEQETIIEKAETMTEESKREENINSELKVLENKVTTDEAALEEENRRIAHENGVLSAKVG